MTRSTSTGSNERPLRRPRPRGTLTPVWRQRVVIAVVATVSAGLSAGCVVSNELFCCTTAESCAAKSWNTITQCQDPSRPYCDDVGTYGPSNTCIPDPMSSACTRSEDCMTPQRPVCDVDGTSTCVRCEVMAECERFTTTPLCEPASGACVECLDSSQCLDPIAPVCSAGFTCESCTLDAECVSGICNKATGACVPEAQIVFVNPSGAGTTCTRAAPCATITNGVAATDVTRRFILVAPGSYSERIAVAGRAFTLVGTGADLSAATAGPLLDVQGSSNVSVEGLRIHDGLGASGDGVRCSDTGGQSAVSLRGVRIETNGGRGVGASNCMVTVTAARVFGNSNGGIAVSGGEVTIRNSFIAKNGSATATIGGVDLRTPMGMTFEFNTVADNVTTSGFAAGVQCSSAPPRTIGNSIIIGQGADQVSSTNCDFAYTISNEAIAGTGNSTAAPSFVGPGANDYHLQPGSTGIDGADPAATLATDIDGQPRPAPVGGRADIGADEVQ